MTAVPIARKYRKFVLPLGATEGSSETLFLDEEAAAASPELWEIRLLSCIKAI
jgi:hypothetical protein